MAGFMSGLGFSSSVGALIGGAAKQGNELFAEQRAQARQDEIMKDSVWADKFDKANEQERETTKQRQNEANLLSSFRQITKGDDRLAFQGLSFYRANPKDLDSIVQRLKTTAEAAGYTPDTATKSPFEDQQAADTAAGQARLQGLYGRLSQKQQQQMGYPNLNPTDYSGAKQQSPTSTQPLSSQAAPATANVIGGNSLAKDPQTRAMLDDFGKWENEDALNKERVKFGIPPVQGVMTRDKLTKNNIDQYRGERAVDNDKIDADIRKNVATTNAKDYLSEVYKRKASITNTAEIYADANNFIRMLETEQDPLKTSSAQPLVDGTNRLLSSFGFDVLEKAGIANHVNNANEAGKVLGRIMFGQIPNYHLGRWTDREFATLRQIIPEMGKDPNTNLKIALLLKAGADRMINSTREEITALGPNAYDPNISAAMQIGNKYLGQATAMPWTSINTVNPADTDRQAYAKLPTGAYWEDSSGILHKKSGS